MRHSAFSRFLRIMALACAASMLAGCAVPRTLQKISPDPDRYSDSVDSVNSAQRRDDGSVAICVTGKPAAPPALDGEYREAEPYSLILPADTRGRLAIDEAQPSLRRYALTGADVAGACADDSASGTPLPVHAVGPGDVGYPGSTITLLKEIPDANLAQLFETRSGPPAVYVYVYKSSGYPEIIYVAPEARFDDARAVHIERDPRPVEGNPAYVVVLPFAVVFDVVVTLPVALLWLAFANATGMTS